MIEKDLLRLCHLDVAEAYQTLFGDGDGDDGALSPRERHLILLGISASVGSAEDVAEYGDRALAEGAPPTAVVEAVLTVTISRGRRALRTALPYLERLSASDGLDGPSVPAGNQTPLEYFDAEFGAVPNWAAQLQDFSPASLAGYATLRRQVLADGAMSRKAKELLTMLLNAISGNSGGIRSHARAAMRFGATKREVLESLVLGIRVGGIVVWINGVNCLAELLG